MRISNFFKLIIAIAISEMAGVIGAFFTAPAVQSRWYMDLVKPAINPPAWVFGPVWTTLFALVGISLFLIWRQHPYILENVRMLKIWRWAMGLFFVQLVLNTLWSIIFFGLHSPGGALIEIVFLWLAIVWTMVVFYKISKPATYLLVPYILWVSFAMYLNYAIWVLN